MAKFNINEYKGKFAMYCKTVEEAQDFCNFLHSVGRTWIMGHSYLEHTNYNSNKVGIVYFFNKGTYGDIHYAKRNNYTILEWSDYMEKKFTKADLKTGDVIKRRNGSVEIIICELDVCICDKGWDDLADIAEDLTCVCGDKRHDIVAVRRPKVNSDCKFSAFSWECGTLVYERPIVEEMTLAEVCKALGKEIKIVKE